MINAIKAAGVFVNDSERAYDFYVGILGFEVRTDQRMGDYRWLELAPHGSSTVLTVARPMEGEANGGFANIILFTDDMLTTYEELTTKGVVFTAKPETQAWGGMMAQFADPDGNIFVLVDQR